MDIRKQTLQLDGPALEYQGLYGSPVGDLNVFDLVNNPAASGVCRVVGGFFSKELGDIAFREIGSLNDNLGDSPLTGPPSVKPLAQRLPL